MTWEIAYQKNKLISTTTTPLYLLFFYYFNLWKHIFCAKKDGLKKAPKGLLRRMQLVLKFFSRKFHFQANSWKQPFIFLIFFHDQCFDFGYICPEKFCIMWSKCANLLIFTFCSWFPVCKILASTFEISDFVKYRFVSAKCLSLCMFLHGLTFQSIIYF